MVSCGGKIQGSGSFMTRPLQLLSSVTFNLETNAYKYQRNVFLPRGYDEVSFKKLIMHTYFPLCLNIFRSVSKKFTRNDQTKEFGRKVFETRVMTCQTIWLNVWSLESSQFLMKMSLKFGQCQTDSNHCNQWENTEQSSQPPLT